MAGNPKKRAMIAELEKRTKEECEPGSTHLDYVVDWVAGGKTMVELAADIKDTINVEVSNMMLSKYIHLTWPETAGPALAAARKRGAHNLVAEAMGIADDAPNDRDAIRKAKLRSDVRLWAAERWNRDELGRAPEVQLNVNVNNLHLDAMRVRTLQPAKDAAPSLPVARAYLGAPEDQSAAGTIDATIVEEGDEPNSLPDQQLDLLPSGL